MMSKLVAGVFFGVFTGALVYEVFRRARPDLDQKLWDQLDQAASAALKKLRGGNGARKTRMKMIPVE
jgi:hypothetical protein